MANSIGSSVTSALADCSRPIPHAPHMMRRGDGKFAMCGVADQSLTAVGVPAERLLADAHQAVLNELRALRGQLETCICGAGGEPGYEGPVADCPIHGAIRAYNILTSILNEAPQKLVSILHDGLGAAAGWPNLIPDIVTEFKSWMQEQAEQI